MIGRATRAAVLAGALLIAGTGTTQAQTFSFEAFAGSALNVPMPLTVHQTGYPDIHLTAHYDTKPFGPNYPYYAWRAEFWNHAGDQAWELRQVHHRLYLTNNPPEIQFFAIHFGYNFFLVGHAWKRGGFVYHVDAGVLICNPENTVRGKTLNTHDTGIFDQGYSFGGIGAEAAVSRDFDITNHIFAVVNAALMGGHGSVPVAEGSADVSNLSVHGQVGVGVRF